MGRGRQIAKIIGPARAGCALIVGLTLNVAIAWWIALSPSQVIPLPRSLNWQSGTATFSLRSEDRVVIDIRSVSVGQHGFMQVRRPSDEGLDVSGHREYYRYLGYFETTDAPARNLDTLFPSIEQVSYERFGLPFHCLYASTGFVRWTLTAKKNTLTVPTSIQQKLNSSEVVPIGVLPIGFLMNILFYSIPTYTLLSIPAVISGIHRRLTNRCTACGYPLAELSTDSCPECGVGVRPRKDA